MSSQSFHRLLFRLSQDLVDLRDDPYPGVAVFTDEANLRNLCLVLTPPSGPWKGLALHFDVNLPEDWPSWPPKIRSSVSGIDHPNIFESFVCSDLLSMRHRCGYTGGYSPALTLRGLFIQFLTCFSGTKIERTEGGIIDVGDYTVTHYWQEKETTEPTSRSYPLEAEELERLWESSSAQEVVVLSHTNEQGGPVIDATKTIQVGNTSQTLHKVRSVNQRWRTTFSIIERWRCASCPYGSEGLPHHQVAVRDDNTPTTIEDCTPLFPFPSRCPLEALNNDSLLELATQLPSESIISFSAAYPRFREVATSCHILLHREVKCFFLHTSLNQSILGVGIALHLGSRALSSDFDWLSMEAFDDFNVRESIQQRRFTFFLPLAFSSCHFERARMDIWKRLAIIDSAVQGADLFANAGEFGSAPRKDTPSPERPITDKNTVTVLYRMMNNIVVSLMKSCEETLTRAQARSLTRLGASLYSSEKGITSYCHLFHLVMCLSRSSPEILHDANWRLRRFVTHPNTRGKKETPDVGQMIVLINLVVVLPPVDDLWPVTWDVISAHYLKEVLTRNVRWTLKEAPELEVMEQGRSNYRLNTTFSKSKTSLRLIMFQIAFLKIFIGTYASRISRLDDNYGFADKELPERMVKEIKDIFMVDTWHEFFSRVRYTHGMNFTEERISTILRQTVRDSATLGYHTPAMDMVSLRAKRMRLDKTSSFCADVCPDDSATWGR